MKLVRESIFSSVVRSFCIAFFSVIGIIIAVFLVLFIFGAGKHSKAADSSTYDIIIPETNGRKYNFSSHKPLILRIDVQGAIGMGQGISAEQIRSQLNESQAGPLKGKKIQAVLLYMNSPGGGAINSESIYYAIKDYALKNQIPVYTFVEGLCASGGLMIACASDKIYATESSMIGSVGTYLSFFNVSGSMKKVGVENWTISKGRGKTAMSPFLPWSENDDAEYLPLLDATYDQFISIVANGRPEVTKEDLQNNYGAAMFMAKKAEQIGYIDGAGYQLNEVADMLAKEANLSDYQVISMVPKSRITDLFKMEPFSAMSFLNFFQKGVKPDFHQAPLEAEHLYHPPVQN